MASSRERKGNEVSMLNDANALGVLTILAKLDPTKGGRKGKAGIGGRATIEADNVYEGGVELTEQTFDDKNVRAGFRINVRGAKRKGVEGGHRVQQRLMLGREAHSGSVLG